MWKLWNQRHISQSARRNYGGEDVRARLRAGSSWRHVPSSQPRGRPLEVPLVLVSQSPCHRIGAIGKGIDTAPAGPRRCGARTRDRVPPLVEPRRGFGQELPILVRRNRQAECRAQPWRLAPRSAETLTLHKNTHRSQMDPTRVSMFNRLSFVTYFGQVNGGIRLQLCEVALGRFVNK